MVFVYQMAKAYEEGRKAKLSLRRRGLIFQTSKILTAIGVPHGIVMAGEKGSPNELIQVCSIDTEYSRNYFIFGDDPTADVHIDECHDCNPKGSKYREFFHAYRDHNVIGYTASPFGDNSYFQKIVHPISASELRDQGYLVKEKVFAPPKATIDTSKVRVVAGEYVTKELVDASSTRQIVGGFVANWKALNPKGLPTILFGITKAHSRKIAEAFNDAGIPSGHLDCDDNQEARDKVIDDLRSGIIKVVCNVDLFTVGVDFPEVGCVQLCRPTKSLTWHIQSIGRGLRPYPGKEHLVVIDHAGNYAEHGSVFFPREVSLEPKPRTENRDPLSFCGMCGFLLLSSAIDECPECGHVKERESRSGQHTVIDDEIILKEVLFDKPQKKYLRGTQQVEFVREFIKFSNIRKKKQIRQPGWEFKQMIEKYGVEECRRLKGVIPRFPTHLLTTTTKKN